MSDYITPGLSTWRKWTDGPLLILAIGSLPLLLLEVDRHRLTYGDRVLLDVVNVAVLVAFAVDYVVELALASPRPMYVRREWTSLLIVVSQTMALVPGLAVTGSLRAMRAGRAFRGIAVVFRLIAIGGASAHEGRALLGKHAARFALGFAGLTWLTAAVAFTLAEDVGEHGRVHSFFDAIWWSASTYRGAADVLSAALLRSERDQHRAYGQPDECHRDAPECDAAEAGAPMARHGDHGRADVLGIVDERAGRVAAT
jgi:hypothetical protein